MQNRKITFQVQFCSIPIFATLNLIRGSIGPWHISVFQAHSVMNFASDARTWLLHSLWHPNQSSCRLTNTRDNKRPPRQRQQQQRTTKTTIPRTRTRTRTNNLGKSPKMTSRFVFFSLAFLSVKHQLLETMINHLEGTESNSTGLVSTTTTDDLLKIPKATGLGHGHYLRRAQQECLSLVGLWIGQVLNIIPRCRCVSLLPLGGTQFCSLYMYGCDKYVLIECSLDNRILIYQIYSD